MESSVADLVVIGGGPGGYPAAFAAADHGLSVVLINNERALGGVCLNRGCIPSKTLLHIVRLLNETRHAEKMGLKFPSPEIDLQQIRQWKDSVVGQLTNGIGQLGSARGVQTIHGQARFLSSDRLEITCPDGQRQQLDFARAIIATGSSPVFPAALQIDDRRVMDSTGALALEDVPDRLLVVGGGYIGLEMGSVYAALGSRVSVVEMTGGLLPGADRELVRPLQSRLSEAFESIRLNTQVERLIAEEDGIVARCSSAEESIDEKFDRVLIAVGRRPNSAHLGLEHTDVELDERGFIRVTAGRRTNDPKIWAIGDVAGEPMLAHKATYEAKAAVASIRGESVPECNPVVPAVVFTDPEVAWCGLTETAAKAERRKVKSFRFPWAASGRAQTLGETDGLTKVIVDPETEVILGVGIVGVGAGELIAEAVWAVQSGATADELADTIHAHPTLAETLMESAEGILGLSTHVYRPRRA